MMDNNEIVNAGGINGTGKGIVNTNSEDYKGLQKAILAHAKNQSPEEKINYQLVSLKFQMQSYLQEEKIENIKEIGHFLQAHIKAIGIKNNFFAKYIDLEASNMSAILKGKRKINTLLAYKLGQIFSTNPNLWLQIQSKNELLHITKEKGADSRIYKLHDLLQKVS